MLVYQRVDISSSDLLVQRSFVAQRAGAPNKARASPKTHRGRESHSALKLVVFFNHTLKLSPLDFFLVWVETTIQFLINCWFKVLPGRSYMPQFALSGNNRWDFLEERKKRRCQAMSELVKLWKPLKHSDKIATSRLLLVKSKTYSTPPSLEISPVLQNLPITTQKRLKNKPF